MLSKLIHVVANSGNFSYFMVEKKTNPMEKKCKKSKMAVWGGGGGVGGGLTNSCEKKRSEKQRRKGKI